jgi:hypothetical protein
MPNAHHHRCGECRTSQRRYSDAANSADRTVVRIGT